MDYSTLPERIARIANLKAFAELSGIHRRTLQRVMQRKGSPTLKTCEEIEKKLREIRPALKPKVA